MFSSLDVFRMLAASHLAVLAVLCLRGDRRDRSVIASSGFLAVVICHLLFPVLQDHGVTGGAVPLVPLLGHAVPFAFWVLARVHFDDDFRLRPLHGLLLAALVGLRALACLQPDSAWAGPSRLLAVAFVVHALIRIYVGAGSDLLLSRIRLRYGVLLVSGTFVLLELLAELLLRGEALALADRVHAAGVYLLSAGVSIAGTLLRPEMMRPVRISGPALVVDPQLASRL